MCQIVVLSEDDSIPIGLEGVIADPDLIDGFNGRQDSAQATDLDNTSNPPEAAQFSVQTNQAESNIIPTKPKITRVELLASKIWRTDYKSVTDINLIILMRIVTCLSPEVGVPDAELQTRESLLIQLEAHFFKVIKTLIQSGITTFDALMLPNTDANDPNEIHPHRETEFTKEDLKYHLDPNNGSMVYNLIYNSSYDEKGELNKNPQFYTRIQALVFVYIGIIKEDLVARDYYLIGEILNQKCNLGINTEFNKDDWKSILCELDRHYCQIEKSFDDPKVLNEIILEIYFNENYLGKRNRGKIKMLKEKFMQYNPELSKFPLCDKELDCLNKIEELFGSKLGIDIDDMSSEECRIIISPLLKKKIISEFSGRNAREIQIMLGLQYDKIVNEFQDVDFLCNILNDLISSIVSATSSQNNQSYDEIQQKELKYEKLQNRFDELIFLNTTDPPSQDGKYMPEMTDSDDEEFPDNVFFDNQETASKIRSSTRLYYTSEIKYSQSSNE